MDEKQKKQNETGEVQLIDKMDDVNKYHDDECHDAVLITINKQHVKTGDKEFDAYKVKLDNKAVNLSLRKEDQNGEELTSKMLAEIPTGISKLLVVDINQDKGSFYPKVYATWYRIVSKELPF